MRPEFFPDGTIRTIPEEMRINANKVRKCQMPECSSDFGLFKSRQYCTCCGRVCCSSCVGSRAPLPPRYMSPQPVCMHCFLKIQRQGSTTPTPSASSGDPSSPANLTPSPSNHALLQAGRADGVSVQPPEGGADAVAQPSSDAATAAAAELYGDASASPPATAARGHVQPDTTTALAAADGDAPSPAIRAPADASVDDPDTATNFEVRLSELQTKSEALRSENDGLRGDLERTRAELATAQEQKQQQQQQQQPAAPSSAIGTAAASPTLVGTSAFDIVQMQVEQLQEDTGRLAQNQAKLKERTEAFETEKKKHRAAEETLRTQRRQLEADQAEHRERAARHDASSRETAQLRAKIEELTEAAVTTRQVKETRASADAEFLAEKEARLAKQQRELLERANELAGREAEYKAAEERVRAAHAAVQARQEGVDSRVAMADARERELAEREGMVAGSQAELDALRQTHVSQQQQQVQALADAEAARSSQTEAQRGLAAAQTEVAQLNDAIEDLKRAVEAESRSRRAAEEHAAASDAKRQELGARLVAAEQRDVDAAASSTSTTPASDEIARLSKEVQRLMAQLESADAESISLRAELKTVSEAKTAVATLTSHDAARFNATCVEAARQMAGDLDHARAAFFTAVDSHFLAAAGEVEQRVARGSAALDSRRAEIVAQVRTAEDALSRVQQAQEKLAANAAELGRREDEVAAREQAAAAKQDSAGAQLAALQRDVQATAATNTQELAVLQERLQRAETERDQAAAKHREELAAATNASSTTRVEHERTLKDLEVRLASEKTRLEMWQKDLDRQDKEVADAAKAAEQALKTKAEELRAAQQRAAKAVSDADARSALAEESAKGAAARAAELDRREAQLRDQEDRVNDLRKDVREKLNTLAAESHKLAALRKAQPDTGTPRTPIVAGPGIGRFAAASESVFRPLDPPHLTPARSPRSPAPTERTGSSAAALVAACDAPLPFRFGDWDADLVAAARADAAFSEWPLLRVAFEATRRLGIHDIVVPAQTWATFLRAAQHHYNPNPYHNALHAADVVHSATCLLEAFPELLEAMPAVEQFALLFAAAIHDIGHPALTSSFLNRILDPVAISANFASSNEYGHLQLAFGLVQQPKRDITTLLTQQDLARFTALVSALVYGTDMTFHGTVLNEVELAAAAAALKEAAVKDGSRGTSPTPHGGGNESGRSTPVPTTSNSNRQSPAVIAALVSNPTTRLQLLRLVLHAADLGATAKMDVVFNEWDARIRSEFDMQIVREQDLGMKVAPELLPNLAFVAKVVVPMFSLIERVWPASSLTDAAMGHLRRRVNPADVPDPSAVAAMWSQLQEARSSIVNLTTAIQEAHATQMMTATAPQQQTTLARAPDTRAQEVAPGSATGGGGATSPRTSELDAAIADKEARLVRLAQLSEQLASSEASMAAFMLQLQEAQGSQQQQQSGTANAREEYAVIPSSKTAIDAAAVVGHREASAREQIALAAHELAKAQRLKAEAAAALEAAEVSVREAAAAKAEAADVIAQRQRLAAAEHWIRTQQASAFAAGAKAHALDEAAARLGVAAQETDALIALARDRVMRLAAIEAAAKESQRLVAEAAERERGVQDAIAASRERRRRVAQARVLQQQHVSEPWHQLEKQIYSFTDALSSIVIDQRNAAVAMAVADRHAVRPSTLETVTLSPGVTP
jgi:chromosome segregation ATPase